MMATSLNNLIGFLRGEIALCGEGASPSNILAFIDAFYNREVRTSQSSVAAQQPTAPHPKQMLDRRFQEKVWTWIMRDPEVRVQQDGKEQKSSISLAEAEGLSPPPLQDPDSLTPKYGIRLFVSKERTWHAIAGHGPDHKKVPPLDFALLGIIAGAKEKGIIQADLIRSSGQDARSVPQRTQRLAERGYIEKRPITARGSKTSLLIHSKYRTLNSIKARQEVAPGFVDFADLLTRIFDVLKVDPIVTHHDLKIRLNMTESFKTKSFARAIRKLEKIGIVKRVRAESEQSRAMNLTHRCIKLVREPDITRDLELFQSDLRVISKDDRTDTEVANANLDSGDDAEYEEADEEIQGGLAQQSGRKALQEVQASRVLPEWSPDRLNHNMIFDAVDRAGEKGIPHWELRRQLYGDFYRRPLENLLGKIVCMWQVSQPLHVRHLAIIRDTEMTKAMSHYVHFTFNNFKANVEKGRALWEAVEITMSADKKRSVPGPNAEADVDDYGFPNVKPRYPQFKGGMAGFRECLRASQPEKYVLTTFDPQIVQRPNGAEDVAWPRSRPRGTAQNRRDSAFIHSPRRKRDPVTHPRQQPTKSAPEPQLLVRPNKYPIGEELYWTQLRHRQEVADREEAGVARKGTKRVAADEDPEERVRKRPKQFESIFDPNGELPIPDQYNKVWNERAKLFVDRPRTGIYISPRGRQGPGRFGGKRGRPRLSRIAIIKSPRLFELRWFTDPVGRGRTGRPQDGLVLKETQEETVYPRCRFFTTSVAHSHPLSLHAHQLAIDRFITSQAASLPIGRYKRKRNVLVDGTCTTDLDGNTPIGDTEGARSKVSTPDVTRPSPSKRRRISSLTKSPVTGGVPGPVQSAESACASVLPSEPTISESQDVPMMDAPMNANPVEHPFKDLPQGHRPPGKRKRLTLAFPAPRTSSSPASARIGANSPRNGQEIGIISPPPAPATQEPSVSGPLEGLRKSGSPLRNDNISGNQTSVLRTGEDRSGHQMPDSQTIQHAEFGPSYPALPELTVEATISKERKLAPKARKHGSVNLTSGSLPLLRRKIVLDVLDKCDGVFPGDNEMWYAYMTEWLKIGRTERADRRTIRALIKALVDVAKVRQLKFSFRDRKGMMVTRTIITKIDVLPSSPKVRNLQKHMIAANPNLYIPPEVEVDPELRRRSDILTLDELRSDPPPHRRAREIPIDRESQVQLENVPAKYRAQDAAQKRKDQKLKVTKVTDRPRKLRPLMPKAPLNTPMQFPPPQEKPILPRKRNVARLQKLNVQHLRSRVPKPVEAPGPDDGPLEKFEMILGRLAPAADPEGATKRLLLDEDQGFGVLKPEKQKKQTAQRRLEHPSTTGSRALRRASTGSNISRFTTSTASTQASDSTESAVSTAQGLVSGAEVPLRLPPLPKSLEEFVSRFRPKTSGLDGATRIDRVINKMLRWELKNEELLTHPSATLSPELHFISLAVKNTEHFSMPTQAITGFQHDGRSQRGHIPQEFQSGGIPVLPRVTLDKMNIPEVPNRSRRLHPRRSIMDEFTEEEIDKIIVVMISTRCLVGGLDSTINWDLVTRLCSGMDGELIKRAWPRIMRQHKTRLRELRTTFQETFVDAYEKGEVPIINFEDIASYPWEELIAWFMKIYKMGPPDRDTFMPATRTEFESSFICVKEPVPSMSELYAPNITTPNIEREYMASRMNFASIENNMSRVDMTANDQLSNWIFLAKSWIRQNAATPEDVYSPDAAKKVLQKLPFQVLESATKVLNEEKVIVLRSRHKNAPGRSWDISEQFLTSIDKRRIITAKNIRRSAWYKESLEKKFGTDEVADVDTLAADGDVLAMQELANEGLISINSHDIPGDALGNWISSKYLTRQMDKEALRFSMTVRPRDGFQNLSALGKITLPPPQGPKFKDATGLAEPGLSFTPLWYDIHGKFFRLMWDLLISAICGLAMLRPDMTITEIQDQLKPVMELWELRCCLQWLEDVELVVKDQKHGGYRVARYWWLRLGDYLGNPIDWRRNDADDGAGHDGRAEAIEWIGHLEAGGWG